MYRRADIVRKAAEAFINSGFVECMKKKDRQMPHRVRKVWSTRKEFSKVIVKLT